MSFTLLWKCAPSAIAQDDVFPSFAVETYFKHDYQNEPNRKALVIGPLGWYSAVTDAVGNENAVEMALQDCEKNLLRLKTEYHAKGGCRVLANGSNLTSPNPWFKPNLGDHINKGFDRALRQRPDVNRIDQKDIRGVLLHLHGCDGLGYKSYHEAWAALANSLGLIYVAPDSYADTRPKGFCGILTPDKELDETLIMKIRVFQTARTLNNLRRSFPGKPIYIWGHSSGGNLAQVLDEKVNGIIVSGARCGYGPNSVIADKHIPILYLFGEEDGEQFDLGQPFPFAEIRSKCAKANSGRRTEIVFVKNQDHYFWPWRPETFNSVSRFLAGEQIAMPYERNAPPGPLTREVAEAIKGKFSEAEGPLAMACGPVGGASSSFQSTSVEDAKSSALFFCDKLYGLNSFKLKEHRCWLCAVKDSSTLDGQSKR